MIRLSCVVLFLAQPAMAQVLTTPAGDLNLRAIATGLEEPWSIGFLPDGGFLLTLRGGELRHYGPDGNYVALAGLPDIRVGDQAGLLDVLVPKDFATNHEILFSFSKPDGENSGTALARALWSPGETTLSDVRVLFTMQPSVDGLGHYGGRLVEARDGTIFLTMGERQKFTPAQDLKQHLGKIVRLNRDGSVPADNPFVGRSDALPEIWSYGHRNPQGASLDLDGNLLENEHGAMGGDEINRIKPGANYGWPIIAYGLNYDGTKIGEGHSKAGVEPPLQFFDPSIAPSGMMVYSGKLWPEWRGDIFVGSLKFGQIVRLDPETGYTPEYWESPATGRVRDIREAPDGTIWYLSVTSQTLWQISPAD